MMIEAAPNICSLLKLKLLLKLYIYIPLMLMLKLKGDRGYRGKGESPTQMDKPRFPS